MTDMRINTHLDEQAAQDLRERARAKRQKQLWLESGLMGCAEGSGDLSTNYKQYFAEDMDKKHPHHVSEK